MKLFRHILFLLVVVLVSPQWRASKDSVPDHPQFNLKHLNHFYSHAWVKPLRYKVTLTRLKRRPVGLNDYYNHDRCLTPLTTNIPYFIPSDDKVLNGYYFNPYLSVPVALRSWRGPPTA
ncbi:hypothetical protein DVR12_24780 [Chitinophaga silvatica]|uniref:Uncharacterized protein n=1 Tax=Chitinophaga silvatica TaxID=2282649 RepID=A0A3E1Y3I0_9BACT|nr:hypothetical protein [Chitinophaga silvatica]RFS19186.1 hypothetical protein DVR12_24780 [Chitinophaga silvatica]